MSEPPAETMVAEQADTIPADFRALWDHAVHLVRPSRSDDTGRMYLLPPALMRVAELVEQSAPYRQLLDAKPWGDRVSEWRVRDALRRAGFYHALQNGGTPEAVWQLLAARLAPHTARLRTLALLDGCRFPFDQFRIGEASVERLSTAQLEALGTAAEVARTFFPAEVLDPSWYTRVWFLTKEEDRELKPSSILVRFGYDVLRQFWEPIAALALYKVDYFGLPIVLESDGGWRLERIQWSEPMSDVVEDGSGEAVELPRADYDVTPDEEPRFAAFLRFFDGAIQEGRTSPMFRLAVRRYLRAIRIAGPYATGDDYEDALLQYVFTLEALLLLGDQEAISDKLATRTAWLVGTSDTVRSETFKAVKALYRVRSSVVHGAVDRRSANRSPDLDAVRDLLRRALVAVLAVRQATESDEQCSGLLHRAAFDQSSQARIATATKPVWDLIDPGPEWRRQAEWGPKWQR